MKNLDNQIAHIESLLQEILQKTNGGSPDHVDRALRHASPDSESPDESEAEGCPFCGCDGEHDEAGANSFGDRPKKGKTIIMISKKGKKNGGDDQLPSVIKDIMGSLMKPE